MSTRCCGNGAEATPAQTVFIFSGEGAHSADTDLSLLKAAPSWQKVAEAIREAGIQEDADQFLARGLGSHKAPSSPVLTVAINILNADLWKLWGKTPSVVLGHSVGEIAAACVAGMITIAEAIKIAYSLGSSMQDVKGAMVHTELRREALGSITSDSGLEVAAINYVVQTGEQPSQDILSATLCGSVERVDAYLAKSSGAIKLKPEHPWHTSSAKTSDLLPHGGQSVSCKFISSGSGEGLASLSEGHWEAWLCRPVQFAAALAAAASQPSIVIEMGAHPTCAAAVKATFGDQLVGYACSMRRGEPTAFVCEQRAALPGFQIDMEKVLQNFSVELGSRGNMKLDYSMPFAEQGLASQNLVPLAAALSPYFPGVGAPDLYRFTSLRSLTDGWGVQETQVESKSSRKDIALEVVGCAARLPGGVDSPSKFWALLEGDDQNLAFASVPAGAPPAAYLFPRFAPEEGRAAAEASGCEGAEAAALDPQHAFALALSQALWVDAGERVAAAAQANPKRIGVYIGAWQPAAQTGGPASAYRTIGSSLSALASRVANAFNLQGPVMTVNTACSSALVAVDMALQDAKAGRIDFAIVGGVNLFGDDQTLFTDLRRAGMLSPTARCHTFSSKADGYVRAEGGALFLLHAGSEFPSRARILGSAVGQNSTRKPLSAVDPVAQEHVVRTACADAGVHPCDLKVVEMHGTGTPLGDPVEVSALVHACSGKVSSSPCHLTAAKMHVGHLESAAGAVGLLKAVLMCEQRRVPAFSVDGVLNPQVAAAFAKCNLAKPGTPAILGDDDLIGVSSFGFAGSNSHVVVAMTPKARALPTYPVVEVAQPGALLNAELERPMKSIASGPMLSTTKTPSTNSNSPRSECCDYEAADIVLAAVADISGDKDAVGFDVELADIGVDSLGLAELLGRLEDNFGAGCLTIDQIMDEPTVRGISGLLSGRTRLAPAKPIPAVLLAEDSVPKVRFAAALSQSNIDIASKTLPVQKPSITTRARSMSADSEITSVSKNCAWIRTTHVGSLPRPSDGDFDLVRALNQQVSAGVDVINDGEWTRENYIADVIDRIEGLRGGEKRVECLRQGCCDKHSMPIADDMQDVPLYASRFTGGNGLITLNPKREAVSELACLAHPRRIEAPTPMIQPMLDGLAQIGKLPSDAFFSVPSPGTLALFAKDLFFHDHAKYVHALGEALAGEFAQIAASGMTLQVDCPDLAMGRHTRWAGLDEAGFLEVASRNVDALNNALRDVPHKQIRVHICWGNYAGPHHKDIPAEKVWPLIGRIKAKYILMECANPAHRMDIVAFEQAVQKGHFNLGQVMVPGLIDTTTARVESPKSIAESLMRFIRAAGHPSRVMAGTDCGFASTAKSTAITADIAWMKIQSLAEGARIATNSFIELDAPVPCRAPTFDPTPFRAVVVAGRDDDSAYAGSVAKSLEALGGAWSAEVTHEPDFEALRWIVDVPLALVGIGAEGFGAAQKVWTQLQDDRAVSRRPSLLACVGVSCSAGVLSVPRGEAGNVAIAVRDAALSRNGFDKRSLVLPNSGPVPGKVDVVVIGSGLLGMLTAKRCLDAGFSVAVLEQRPLVGGIWSMYANATSQVNSSEGGYCLKDLIGEDGGKYGDNRDHSTAAEVLRDFAKLGAMLQPSIYTCVKVVKVLGANGDYTVFFEDSSGNKTTAGVTSSRGVVLCINDRVGLPRPLSLPGQSGFAGVVADGTADSLAGVDWQGKKVVVVGMGAFAVENVRTALDHGASEVTVIARRHGTICPKAIDYLNFVKPWDEHYKHDTNTNVKQFLKWKELYSASGATVPECWPKQVKHDGHTISVSDVWFIAHHMKKLSTRTGEISRVEPDGVVVGDDFIPCDILVGCIGFERSNYFCESLTGRTQVKTTNYLDKDMMYLADAEIDEGAFNYFFGSSVLEYGKFFTNVYVEGLKRGDELGHQLWGSQTVAVPVGQRKWSQYINSAGNLIEFDASIAAHARSQVDKRTEHFWRTLPPRSFLETNRREWEEMHTRLNGGKEVPKDEQLPYFFEAAPDWC